ncbi:MAG: hypothetical protein LC749_01580 [Actinobacteria bacterium]|nr:hypothetical protein [Actinomycetota bacterium]
MPRVTDTHDCPAGCGAQVPRHQFACRTDWFRLPKPYRDAIWQGYRKSGSGEHLDAMGDAIRWYQDNQHGGAG